MALGLRTRSHGSVSRLHSDALVSKRRHSKRAQHWLPFDEFLAVAAKQAPSRGGLSLKRQNFNSDYSRGEPAARREGDKIIVTVDAPTGGAVMTTYRYVLEPSRESFRIVGMDLAREPD